MRRNGSDSDSDEVYDEIDKFHQEQDNEILKDLNKRKSRSGTEEVLGVYESDSELTDSSEDSVVEDDGKNRDKDFHITTDAWGKKRSEFYGTQADEDYGNWDEERDEQLELEEEDAIRRQKRLDAGLNKINFAALLESDDEEDVEKHKTNENDKDKETKSSANNTTNKYLSLANLMKEYDERNKTFKNLKPLLTNIITSLKNSEDGDVNMIKQLKHIISTYTYFLRNLAMFLRIKDTNHADKTNSEKHPILDDITRIYPTLEKIDTFVKARMPLFRRIATKMQKNPELVHKTKSNNVPVRRKAPEISSFNEKELLNSDEHMDIDDDEEDNGKRSITYEMQKNRGLTVKRKKGTTHSRIKKRVQYKKALLRRRSQVPDVRREVTKYDGEKRGIRMSTVRSIKLKA